jgi:hypothetical protein
VELPLALMSCHIRFAVVVSLYYAVVVALFFVPGGQALGPFQWQAPEVCKETRAVATNQAATLATTPSDVYMLGAY